MTRIENDYKVNQNHHFSNEMTSDLVQEMVNGKLIWTVYLFAANAVTPSRVMEFDSCDLAEDWAVVQGSKLHTYFGLGLSDDCDDCTDDKLCERHYPFDTRSNEEIANDLWNDSNPENCDACANQESIAAPGQTTKCRTHQEYETMEDVVREEIETDEIENDDDAKQWYIDRASEFEFHPFVSRCSMCFDREAFYIGVTTHGTPFEFCRVCRDELVRRADAMRQSPERFGV